MSYGFPCLGPRMRGPTGGHMCPPAGRNMFRPGPGRMRPGHQYLQLQCLHGEEFLEPEAPQLATVTGLLVAPERRQRVEGPAVDLHLARAEPARDSLGALLIARPHTPRETVVA